MKDWLVSHGIKNVWQQPQADRKLITKPGRLSRPEGELFGMQVSEYSIRLPIKESWFHVHQLGNLNADYVGIRVLWDSWVRLDRILNEYGTMITIYNEEGRTYPLHKAWIRKLPNNNIIVATEISERQLNFRHYDMFIRFYDGHFRYTDEYDAEIHKTYTEHMTVRNPVDLSAVTAKFRAMQAREGEPMAYVNGWPVNDINSSVIEWWDEVELVHDGLVKHVYYFPLKDIPTFTSSLDSKKKYLLHPPKGVDSIEFYNDADIHLLKGIEGRYYHLHRSESLRQVTHHDYSIPTIRVSEFISNMGGGFNAEDVTLKMVIRHSGMNQPLIFENSRIHELYKLTDEQIISAMVGLNSTVQEWKAASLEDAAYLKLMASSYNKISNPMVTDAYGYNAISRYGADTPSKVVPLGNFIGITLPPLLARRSVVYEYDKDGILLGFYQHQSDTIDEYYCQNADCVMIEAIEGTGGYALDIDYDAKDYTVDPRNNYRFYLNKLESGVPTDEFEDVTGDDETYVIDEDGTVIWDIDETRRAPVVWADTVFLAYEFEANLYDGLMSFSINHQTLEDTAHRPLYFTPESLDLWLNGRGLVMNVDYFVQWPHVVICNKEYLDFAADRHRPTVTVRCRGLATELREPKHGFVIDGMLSNNTRFDVRDDKVVRINVGGSTYHREDIIFREDMGISVANIENGRPYCISDTVVPLRGHATGDTYELRDTSRELDGRIEDYLSVFIPQAPTVDHNPIDGRYTTFSPIMNQVIHDLLSGILNPVEDDDLNYISTRQFDLIMEPYLWVLDYDPVRNDVDMRYVEVHPHDGNDVIELEPLHYSIIEKINDRYLRNVVVLNKLLRVKVS